MSDSESEGSQPDYESFDQLMDLELPDFSWEELEVTTEDGQTLKMQHIWKEASHSEEKGPVMIMPGQGMTSVDFLGGGVGNAEGPWMTQIADLGHDIYMVNARGNNINIEGVDKAVLDSEEFWEYDMSISSQDIVALAKAMYENAGENKGWYYGYSQGALMGLITLATREEEMDKYFNRAVLLASCLDLEEPALRAVNPGMIQDVRELGIWATGGENWDANVDKICNELSQEACKWAGEIESNYMESLALIEHYQ